MVRAVTASLAVIATAMALVACFYAAYDNAYLRMHTLGERITALESLAQRVAALEARPAAGAALEARPAAGAALEALSLIHISEPRD